MKCTTVWAFCLCAGFGAAADLPREVEPGSAPGAPPSDAVILFDGKDVSQWTRPDGSPTGCTLDNGAMQCKTGAGDAVSKARFHSAQLHLEFEPPYMPEQKSQARGNSGVYLQSHHEIQILDSYHQPTYATGLCGALYAQAPPLVVASRPPAQWQTYDMIYHGPQCDASGHLTKKGTVTVIQNGILIQDHVEINDTDKACAEGLGGPLPLLLQDHNYKGAPDTQMRFRNIWFRPLAD